LSKIHSTDCFFGDFADWGQTCYVILMLCFMFRKKNLQAELRQVEQEYEKIKKDTEQLLAAI